MSQQLVQKLWNYGIFLRDDGLSYDDDVEQLTFLLFLKMADEQTKPNLDSRESMKREWKGIELNFRTRLMTTVSAMSLIRCVQKPTH